MPRLNSRKFLQFLALWVETLILFISPKHFPVDICGLQIQYIFSIFEGPGTDSINFVEFSMNIVNNSGSITSFENESHFSL